MSYRNDIRILMPVDQFTILKEKTKDNYLMTHFDVYNNQNTHIYFGWDYISWNEFDKESDEYIISKFLSEEASDYHFIRVGENWDDFEEIYKLESDINCIQHTRGFEDPIDRNNERPEEYKMTLERETAIRIMESIPQLDKLKNEAWYNVEDIITNIIRTKYIKESV